MSEEAIEVVVHGATINGLGTSSIPEVLLSLAISLPFVILIAFLINKFVKWQEKREVRHE